MSPDTQSSQLLPPWLKITVEGVIFSVGQLVATTEYVTAVVVAASVVLPPQAMVTSGGAVMT